MALFVNSTPSLSEDEERYRDEETGIFNEFGKGFGAGVDQLQALAGGAKALAGSAVGNDDWFYDGMEYFEEQMAEANENAADVGRIEDIEGLGDLVNYSAFVVGNVVPSLIGGGGFGAAGGAIAKNIAISQGAKALVKKNAESLAKSAAQKQYAQTAIGRETLGKVGLRGQQIGATAFGSVMGAGESFTRIFDETGEEAIKTAIVTGILSGALDAATPMRVLKRVLPQNLYGEATQKVADNVLKNQSVMGRAFQQAVETAGVEGGTEMLQEILQNGALELVRDLQDPDIEKAYLERLFDEERQSQYINAFVAGAIGGGAIGGVTGAATKNIEGRQNLDESALKGEPEDGSPEVVLDEEQVDQDQVEEDIVPPEETDKGGDKVQAARAKGLGLPTARTSIAPKTPEQVRSEIESYPDRGEASDPQLSQEEARAKARAQIDGLPAVREKIKEIYQMELGTLGETTRIPKDKEPVTEESPEFGGNLPESITPRMEELVGQDVDYNGNKGPVLKKDDGFYVATQDNGDVLIESGEYQSPEQLGVVPTGGKLVFEKDVQIDDNNKFELRGKKYSLTRIVRDADGNPLSLAVRDENGAKKTIRTPEVVARINSQKNPAPDFNQIVVELDDLPASIQKQLIQQSDADNLPDSVPASQAIEIAQTLPNAEAVVEEIQELATASLTLAPNPNVQLPAVKYEESITRPSMKPLAQAISEVNETQGSNRSPVDAARIESLFDSPEVTLQNGAKVNSPEAVQSDEIKSALVDLLGAGMPKRVLNYVNGIYAHTSQQLGRDADGSYIGESQIITLHNSRLKELIADEDSSTPAAAELRFNLAHEVGHAFDVGTGHTSNSPEFSIQIDGMTRSGVTYELGPLMHELGQNYLNGTELGQELSYPFAYAFDWIAEEKAEALPKTLNTIQKEAFAQAFAVFHASPDMLREQAPRTYKHLEKLLRTQPTEINQDGEANIRSPETDSQPTEVQGDVRSPTESGGSQVQEQDGAGGDGGSSVNAEQAGQGLGEQTQRETGDETGRPLQLDREYREVDPVVENAFELGVNAKDFKREFEIRLTNVRYPDAEYQIYREKTPAKQPDIWRLTEESADDLGLDSNDPVIVEGIGATKLSAVRWINKKHGKSFVNPVTPYPLELDDLDYDLDDFDDDTLFIPRRDLSPEAQNITASGVLYGDEEIQVTGTSRNGATVVVDLARAFDARVKEATNGGNLGDQNDANAEVVSDLIAHEAVQAMNTDGNAGEWYQQKVANAMSLAAQEFPELATDPNAKFAFTAIMAITSNGASVPENSTNTFAIYRNYRDGKVFPDFGVGKEAQAMKSSFALLNRLIQLEGVDSVREFMDKDVTVKVLKDEFGLSVSGELMGTKLKGSAILGPKIGGGFYQNLNGNFDPLTMDRWFMRTWGRLTGTLMADAERKLPVQLAKFREVALSDEYRGKLKSDGISRRQLSRDDEYAKSYATKIQSAYANGGFKDKNAINKASNTFKNSQGEKQAPQNGKEREYIRSVMMMALDKVNQTSGSDPVNMGALQAIVWYPEKDLYKQLGVGNAKSEPTDYETEFKKIVEARNERGSGLSGPDGTAQQSGAGRLEPTDGRDDQDTGQPASRQDEQSNAEADQLDAPPSRNSGSNISDLSARREMNNLMKFREELSDGLKDTVRQKQEFTQAAKADGFFGDFDRGVRYVTTQETGDGSTASWNNEILGLTMSRVGKMDRSGEFNPMGPIPDNAIIEGPDGKDYFANGYVKTVNPDGDEVQTTAAIWKLEKLASEGKVNIMGGLRSVQNLDDQLDAPPSRDSQKPADLTKVIPKVARAYKQFKAGEIDRESFDNTVLSTISEYEFVPEPATYDEMSKALDKRKRKKINIEIKDGEVVGLRLDIPSYIYHDTWVPTIHGDKTSHRATAAITNVKFGDENQPAKAQKVMEGGSKTPFAQMRGAFVNRTDAENKALAEAAINDPDWIQVGFDPRRHSYFYDRKTGQPVLSAEEVIQVGPLVLAKKADTSGSSSDFLYAPTRTAVEIMSDEDLIDSVRTGTTSGGESGIPSNGIKKWLQKNFSSRGLLPETAFDSMIQRDGEFGAVELDIRQMVGIYDNAVVENFGNIDGQQRAVLDKAMKQPASEIEATSLPRDIKDSLIAMRGYIDSLSKQYARILVNDIELLQAQGDEAASAKVGLLNIVLNNMGTYANRSYQAFNNKNWNKEVPEEVILAARSFLVEEGTVNPDQVINTILKEGTAYDDMASFISESKLGAKDLSILAKRKQIAPEIRALLGEYKDPRVNFANSASKMSRLIYNDRFLKEVMENGKGIFLFDQESAPVDATKKIAEVGSKTMTPLNGMYTYPEVEQAFKDALGKEEMGDLYRTIIKVNGLVKYGKTVIAPTTMFRNFMSASMFTIANGHFNWTKLSKSAEVAGSYFSGIGDGVEYLKNLKRLGVVHDNPYAGEMIAYLQDANAQGFLDQRDPSAILGVRDRAFTMGKSAAQLATKAYQFGDDFWKIVGFENEVMSFMENKGVSREEAEPLAAKRIRDTYPTYSLIGKIPQQLRRFPLAGTFVSFPAEIVRTQANMIKYLREDLADPDMRPAALKRIAGMAMMSAGVYAAQAMAMSSFGVSEEEEEAIKLMAAPWAKNSNILVTGRDDQGRLEYLDLTHLDPYALMKRPLNALMRDQPIDDALIDASAEILKPFLGWDISTNTILEFIQNEKSSGGQVYNEADTFINKAGATYLHFERGMGPSVIQNFRRTSRALGGEVSKSGRAYDVDDEMAAFVGFRKTTFDPKTALHFKAYEFSEGKRQSTRLLTSVFRNPNDVSDSDIREAFGRASTARRETFEDMAALVNAAMSSGLTKTQAMAILRSNGVTKKDAKALIDGGASAWTMSDSTLKNSIAKSDILFGQQKSKEFVDRWSLIQQLLNEEANQ